MVKKDFLAQTIFEFQCDRELALSVQKSIEQLHYIKNDCNDISEVKFLNQKEEFLEIHQWFKSCVNQVVQDLNLPFKDLIITESWSNKAEKNQWHHCHKHPNSYLSGIFYLSTSSTGGFTWFSTDSIWYKHFLVFDNLKEDFIKDSKHLVIQKEAPKLGKLLLFPSNLYHSVDGHCDDEPRYSIAFNTFPNMLIFKHTEYLNITTIPRLNNLNENF